MCEQCWEDYGKPSHTSPEIEYAVELIAKIYDFSVVAIPPHSWLDDWNIEHEWYPWPLHRAETPDDVWAVAEELSSLMNSLPIEDRAAALAHANGYTSHESVIDV